ncbi:MAG TPA: class II aldolase/adducin family protein [Candidatus Omnitrophota bacterium]|nr:class II aldolase/adducin family protein [Candidatus Omnitrophota bacterium]HPD85529.1 class II aldolase/adducin family protein [Candidatus Omnitrophota bacterium]HRZ04431.1 class II aldolase/adducin family protein [Candidatus Omnitrophota bacterium]
MSEKSILQLKNDMIEAGKLLWDKNLATGLNGNISCRVDGDKILLTGRNTCLGRLSADEIVLLDLKGNVIGEGKPSSEKPLHTEIYNNFPDAKAIIHTHTTYTNAFYSVNVELTPSTFEARLYLGKIESVEQHTPSVTDVAPVIAALKKNSIMVLRNHGAVAMGNTLFDCFLLIQGLEEAVKIDVISRLYKAESTAVSQQSPAVSHQATGQGSQTKKYKLFSKEQMDEIVKLVNNDAPLKELGQKTQMTMDLAVKLNETGQVYSFSFKDGRIIKTGSDENAEFLISASEGVWRAVFNREIDPFVATTQKKMNLRGDFARISKWYAPCSRIFEVWTNAGIE